MNRMFYYNFGKLFCNENLYIYHSLFQRFDSNFDHSRVSEKYEKANTAIIKII